MSAMWTDHVSVAFQRQRLYQKSTSTPNQQDEILLKDLLEVVVF
jgi:hypothetical protein